MGGFGSGEYERDDTKTTVQACLTFGVGNFQGRLSPASAGTLLWKRGETVTDFMVFDVTESEMGLCLRLHYRLGDAGASGIEGAPPCPPELLDQSPETKEVHIPVRLQETRPTFGGKRWWFTCPLTVNGVACNRRVGKLYLPPGARYFGCRHCYDLTYWSAQHAHEQARAMAWTEKQWSDLCRDVGSGQLLALLDQFNPPLLFHGPFVRRTLPRQTLGFGVDGLQALAALAVDDPPVTILKRLELPKHGPLSRIRH